MLHLQSTCQQMTSVVGAPLIRLPGSVLDRSGLGSGESWVRRQSCKSSPWWIDYYQMRWTCRWWSHVELILSTVPSCSQGHSCRDSQPSPWLLLLPPPPLLLLLLLLLLMLLLVIVANEHTHSSKNAALTYCKQIQHSIKHHSDTYSEQIGSLSAPFRLIQNYVLSPRVGNMPACFKSRWFYHSQNTYLFMFEISSSNTQQYWPNCPEKLLFCSYMDS